MQNGNRSKVLSRLEYYECFISYMMKYHDLAKRYVIDVVLDKISEEKNNTEKEEKYQIYYYEYVLSKSIQSFDETERDLRVLLRKLKIIRSCLGKAEERNRLRFHTDDFVRYRTDYLEKWISKQIDLMTMLDNIITT